MAAKKGAVKRPAAGTGERSRAAAPKRAATPRLLAGGNPQIAMGAGDAPVQAYIGALSGWKRNLAVQLDALIVREVPGVAKAVKWNSPFYGVPDMGWFVSFHTFTDYIKVTFFLGALLRPAPGGGTTKDARWINVTPDDFDEARLADWIRQAAAIPGWLA